MGERTLFVSVREQRLASLRSCGVDDNTVYALILDQIWEVTALIKFGRKSSLLWDREGERVAASQIDW